MNAKLIFQNGASFEGKSFGYEKSISGEMVFSTGMVGYPESFTDPSYEGQILVLTYPLVGNYGVPDKKYWESDRIHIAGLIVSSYIDTPSHISSRQTLSEWLVAQKIPALEIRDTRVLAIKLREEGSQLGKIIINNDIEFTDPNQKNLVEAVSSRKVTTTGDGPKTVVLLDCGAKKNIARSLNAREVRVITVPWDYDVFAMWPVGGVEGLVISNGPGNPKIATKTIATVSQALSRRIPTLGICLGNQILALAAGGNTSKLKFGHRSQNQPCILEGTKRCYLTTQNHGFHVSKVPHGFVPWFTNANDGTNEGIIHKQYPFMSVQFHPEAAPGPVDTEWIFDYFLKKL